MRSSLRRFQSLHSLVQLAQFIGRAPVAHAFGGTRPQNCVPIHSPQSILKRTSKRNGFDQIDINGQVIAQAQELFLLFDHLMQFAQSRRVAPLREICVRREFGRRARAAVSRDEAFANSADNLSYSLMRIGVGWTLGTIAGIAVGFAIGLFTLACKLKDLSPRMVFPSFRGAS